MSKRYSFSLYCPVCSAYKPMESRESFRVSSGLMQCGECKTPLRYNRAGRSVMAFLAVLLISLVGSRFFFPDGMLPRWFIYPVLAFPVYVVLILRYVPRMVVDYREIDPNKEGQIIFTVILLVISLAVTWELLKSF